MAAKGPVPKRSTQRLGHRTVAEKEQTQTVVVPKTNKLYGPPLGIPGLHPLAVRDYEALRRSGQAEFFEPSDWAQAAWVAVAMDRGLTSPKGLSAIMFAAINAAKSGLLVTEGDRRRVRMELERQKPVDVEQTRAKGTVDALRTRLTIPGPMLRV